MPTLSRQFLQSLDINLDNKTYEAFSEHFEKTLEDRVIESILDELNEQQLAELSTLRDQDDQHLQVWLQENVPNLNELIKDEIDILLGDLAEDSDKI